MEEIVITAAVSACAFRVRARIRAQEIVTAPGRRGPDEDD
jgi:hypothetical protein